MSKVCKKWIVDAMGHSLDTRSSSVFFGFGCEEVWGGVGSEGVGGVGVVDGGGVGVCGGVIRLMVCGGVVGGCARFERIGWECCWGCGVFVGVFVGGGNVGGCDVERDW